MTTASFHASGVAAALACFVLLLPGAAASAEFTEAERAMLATFAPWPAPWQADDSNRGSGHPLAIAAGAKMFFDPGLSGDASLSCSSCHDPQRGYTDAKPVAHGLQALPRNTPTVLDTRWQRWFGWGGAHDNLWSQTLKAIVTPAEMGGSAARTRALVAGDPGLRCAIETAFDVEWPAVSDEQVLVLAAKSIAAFQETLVSPPGAFDEFVRAIQAGDGSAAERYPRDALAGYRLFVGKGRCNLCHMGPRFTNDEFANAAVPYFSGDGVDRGRYQGVKRLRESSFTRMGPYSDAPDSPRARFAKFARLSSEMFGAFKVPSLRNLVHTAPYMHDGSSPTLESVVEHYSALDESRLHNVRASVLRALRLNAREKRELVTFLRSLSAPLPADRRSALIGRLDSCKT